MRNVLVPLPPLNWGGLQAFAVNMNPALRRLGWNWVLAVPEEATEVRQRFGRSGVDVVGVPMSRLRATPVANLRTLANFRREMGVLAALGRERDVEIVQAVGAHHYHGPLAARMLHRPLVWQIHSNILPAPLQRATARVIERLADVIMTNGTAVARSFWKRDKIGCHHFVFYAPVNTDAYVCRPEVRAEARRSLQLTDSTVVVGTVGAHVWQKNHALLMDVAERVIDADIRFLVVGQAVETYQDTYEITVRATAERLNAHKPSFVRFIDAGCDVAKYLNAFDIFILTSHAEGMPIALAEAMSTGLPAICTNVGSICEVVIHGETGYLTPPGDAAALAGRVLQLCGDPELRAQMGMAARRRIVQAFSIDDIAATHVAAYEYALARRVR
jgi:glycosyltransferase involved in cell wall biosynthesis